MSSISSILCGEYPAIRNLLSRVYFRNFCDRMAMTLLPRFLDCVARCKRVNEMSAQQMLLDLHSLKTLFLQLPTVQQNETDEMKYVIPPTLGRGGRRDAQVHQVREQGGGQGGHDVEAARHARGLPRLLHAQYVRGGMWSEA